MSNLTLGSLVEGVLASLYGQTAQQDRVLALTSSLGPTDTSFTVDDATDMSTGLVEIDMELVRVSKVNPDTGTVTLHPSGRGVRGTAATSHTVGAEVRVQPIIPYSSVVREIQAELNNLYPSMSSVSTYEFTSNMVDPAYALPADVGLVLDVRYKDFMGHWQRVRRWEVEFNQNTTDFPTGVALRVFAPEPTTIRVIYGKPYGKLVSLTDSLATAGIQDSIEDILRLGAVIRLLPTLDIAHLSVITVPGSDSAGKMPQPGTGVMVARELKAMYKDRVDSEVGEFRLSYPARIHLTR